MSVLRTILFLAAALNSVVVTCVSVASEPLRADCLLLVQDKVDVASTRDGLLTTLGVRLGDEVESGDLLVELAKSESEARRTVALSERKLADAKYKNDWPIRVAEANLKGSSKEVELLEEVGRSPFLERFRAATDSEKNRAELRLAEATQREDKLSLEIRDAELMLAEIDLAERTIRAPLTGIVTREFKYDGEYVLRGDPIVRIVRMDRLVLQAFVNLRDIAPHQVQGLEVTATFTLPGESPLNLTGLRIERVAAEVDLDGSYLVWTSVENMKRVTASGRTQWLLRPGMTGTISIEAQAKAVVKDSLAGH